MRDGLRKEDIGDYLLSCGWFQDFSRYAFQYQPEEFIHVLINEMIRSGGARWQGSRLVSAALYTAPEKGWLDKSFKSNNWK